MGSERGNFAAFTAALRTTAKAMSPPEHFEVNDDYARFRPVGAVSFESGLQLLREAIIYSRKNRLRKLLINVTNLTGFTPPTTLERLTLGKQIAEDGMSAVRIAMVAQEEMLDPRRFGVTVARNRGLITNAFACEEEAVRWLLDPKAK